MKLHLLTSLITILSFIVRLDAIKFDPSAWNAVYSNASGYTEHHLKFKNWLKLSDDQKEAVLAEYLDFIRTPGHKPLSIEDFQSFRDILLDTQLNDLLDYVNQYCARFKHASRVDESVVDAIIFQYVRNQLERDKNYNDLLEVAKTLEKAEYEGSKTVYASRKDDVHRYPERHDNVFETPKYRFSYGRWQKQDQDEKEVLVTGYVAFLHIVIKEDWCYNEEERSRYDQFCKLVSVNDLVNHVDKLYRNPLYRDGDPAYMIYEYMIYNFQIFIGDPIVLQG